MTGLERRSPVLPLLGRLGSDAFLRSLMSNGFAALLIKTGTAGLSYAMFVAFARLLSEQDFGRFAFGFSLATALAAVAGLGLSTAVLRFWPECKISGRADLALGFVGWGFRYTLAGSLLTAVGLIGAGLLYEPAGQFAYYAGIGLLLAAMAVSEFGASALRADGRTILALAPRDIVWRIGVMTAVWMFAAAQSPLDAASSLILAGALLAAITVWQSSAARIMTLGSAGASVPAGVRASWRRAALPMWAAAVLFAMVQQFDVVLIGLLLSPEQAGAYFAAFRTASLIGLTLIAGSMVGAPLIARYYHAQDDAGLAKLCRSLSLCIALPALGGFIFLLILGRWLLGLFDPGFATAYPVLVVLASSFGIDALCGPTAIVLQMIGRERDHLKLMALTYAATLAAQIILTPAFGAIGAAVPSMLGMIGWNVLALRLLRSRFGLDCSIFALLRKPPPIRASRSA
jgi:O-antigen/teichoic acid export membrane protein